MDFILLLLSPWVCVCSVAPAVSDSVRPHGLSPSRLLCPWDSPGKNAGVAAMPPPGALPESGIEPGKISYVSCIGGGSLPLAPPGKPLVLRHFSYFQAHTWCLFQGVPSPHPLFVFTLPRVPFFPLLPLALAFTKSGYSIFFV